MSQSAVDLTEFFVPPSPADEIPRDALVRHIASKFGPECRVQMLVGQVQAGKTSLLAQFCRYYKEQAISYFITDSPLSQQQHAFLYSMCFQLGMVLDRNPPPENIRLEDLKSLFTALCTSLKTLARFRKTCA